MSLSHIVRFLIVEDSNYVALNNLHQYVGKLNPAEPHFIGSDMADVSA
jgi:hypothetical protein